ncbi:V0D/AC39 family V-type ATPase subunit [Anaeromicropila herbilytica]|uniref:V-type ATP synthase subunit C n=1 Tax=Anaeromicropila herbilytica TaxID=2785025 RepID=A0A7R7EQN3_9FIRM|nr:V-type ATPase subunit [Anaeromicropila herbilytica]BCN33001.1 hypothetical protein bsdtb5_42960 [Anaeromicropila herbilytica]
MSGNLIKYSAITTKVRAMQSHLLTSDDFKKLSNMETTTEFIAYLKKHPGYASFFASFDEQRLHRGEIERILSDTIFFDYAKIYRFASLEQRKILDIYLSYFEIKVLKECLQYIFHKERISEPPRFKPHISSHFNLNVEALTDSKTMDEFISNLRNTEYHSLFLKLQNSSSKSLFDYQIQLDIYYFQKIWGIAKRKLRGTNSNVLSSLIGKEIDLLNILWVYRFKKYYKVNSTDINSCMIPIHYKLSKSDLTKLIETNSLDDFLKAFESTYYYKTNKLEEMSIEDLYYKILQKAYKTSKVKNPSSIAPIVYYLFLKSQQIDRLTTALECVRYNLEPNETLKYVLQ